MGISLKRKLKQFVNIVENYKFDFQKEKSSGRDIRKGIIERWLL